MTDPYITPHCEAWLSAVCNKIKNDTFFQAEPYTGMMEAGIELKGNTKSMKIDFSSICAYYHAIAKLGYKQSVESATRECERLAGWKRKI